MGYLGEMEGGLINGEKPFDETFFFPFSLICSMIVRLFSSIVKNRYFEKQFELAHAMKLPMFLHMRAAAEDFCHILEQNKER